MTQHYAASASPTTGDETSLKRLVLVRRLYLEGVERATHQHNYSDLMLAVIDLFLAVETAMGCVVLAEDQQPNEADGTNGYAKGHPSREQVSGFNMGDYHKFEQLHDQVVAILRSKRALGPDEPLMKWSSLERLQKARNDAQHGARAPHPSDLPELAAIARESIDRIVRLRFRHFGSSMAEISLANLIEDDVLRQFVQRAQTMLEQGRNEACASLVRVAFLLGRLKRRYDWWKDRQGHRVIDDYDAGRHLSEDWEVRPLSSADERRQHQVMMQVLRLPKLYDNYVLGLDAAERDKLFELTPRLVHYPEGTPGCPPSDETAVITLIDHSLAGKGSWPQPRVSPTPSRDDCLWILDYTIETLLRWQQEQRGTYAPIDPICLGVLPELETVSSAP